MAERIFRIDEVPQNLLSDLDSRDVGLWIESLPDALLESEALVEFMGLPWRMILSKVADAKLIKKLEDYSNSIESLIRKRGFTQIIDSDPSRIELPQRCLPIYLLNGRQGVVQDDYSYQRH